ncbi:MAG TPA: hypothetical protein VJ400_07080 [Thermoplasmata archaeon]|nr:hypothetical protein [Thermoplasmata archaeon]
MRTIGLIFAGLGMLLAPFPAASATAGYTVELWTNCVPGDVNIVCQFVATPSSPNLMFFRFDFNRDGLWDYPSQDGGGTFGIWAMDTRVYIFFSEPFWDACVQAWDGTSTRREGDEVFPDGPVGCTDFTSVLSPADPPKSIRPPADPVPRAVIVPTELGSRDTGYREDTALFLVRSPRIEMPPTVLRVAYPV